MNNEEYDKLTEKQKRFIDYYVETANATESARRAGYSKKTAKNIGAENLTKLHHFITERMKQKASDRIASQDEVLEYLTRVMRGEETDAFGLDASLQDRTKCAELLGKRYGTFTDKIETKEDKQINIIFDIPRPTKENKDGC